MSLTTKAIQPIRLCRTCLLRQSVTNHPVRWLHTSRPASRNVPESKSGKTQSYRSAIRPPPKLSVDDFKPPPTPREARVAALLFNRIEEWSNSVRTTKKLEAYSLQPAISRQLLRSWSSHTSAELKGVKKDEEARAALEKLGFDHQRLKLAIADDDFSSTLEAAFLRNFLHHTVTSSNASAVVKKHLNSILQATDLSRLPYQHTYTPARAFTRNFHLHIGPTNSGKTYSALKALARAKSGAYAGPLRLLAHEVWERMNLGTVGGMEEGQGRECNLLTGEERRIVSSNAGLISCTVEMLPHGPIDSPYDVVVIDEIQMLGDSQRGGAWTSAVLGVQAREIHLCGDETTVQLLHSLLEPLGDTVTVHRYDRLTPLQVADKSLENDWSNVQPGDCVVTFSRSNIFAVKRQIESVAGRKCAVVYGALPPETRADQARDFNDEEGRAEVLVASDAVGMGLNLKINRMIFESLHKFNGKEEVPLALTQIKQIAGRAGRYGMQRSATAGKEDPTAPDDSPAPGGSVTTLHPDDLPILKSLLPLSLPQITRATLDIPSHVVNSFATLLPPNTTFAELLSHISDLALLPPHTVLTNNHQRAQLADVIEPMRDSLTMKEMETFSFAPVNTRDAQSVSILQAVVAAFADTGRVDLLQVYDGTGLINNLETVEKTLEALPPLPPIEVVGQKTITPPVIVSSIPALEVLHKTLVMYIWLSFRFDVSFPDRPLAVSIKERVEKVLDQCLARLPGLKLKKTRERRKEVKAVDEWKWKHVGSSKSSAGRVSRGNEQGEQKKKIEYAGKEEDQARKRSEVWKNVGILNDARQ